MRHFYCLNVGNTVIGDVWAIDGDTAWALAQVQPGVDHLSEAF